MSIFCVFGQTRSIKHMNGFSCIRYNFHDVFMDIGGRQQCIRRFIFLDTWQPKCMIIIISLKISANVELCCTNYTSERNRPSPNTGIATGKFCVKQDNRRHQISPLPVSVLPLWWVSLYICALCVSRIFLATMCKMASSTKPEVQNVSQLRQRRTEPLAQATCKKVEVKLGHMVSEICSQTHRYTHHDTSLPHKCIGLTSAIGLSAFKHEKNQLLP